MSAFMLERGRLISCGCCVGPVEDRCCCHFHQDISRGLVAHKCSMHCEPVEKTYTGFDHEDPAMAAWLRGEGENPFVKGDRS